MASETAISVMVGALLETEDYSDATRETFKKLGAYEKRIVENIISKIIAANALPEMMRFIIDPMSLSLMAGIGSLADDETFGPARTIASIIERVYDGQDKYGEFRPSTEKRDFKLETFHELVDALVYTEADAVFAEAAE